MTPSIAREAQRQQQLLRVLWRDDAPQQLLPWLRGAEAASLRGLQAYRAHAGSLAERALNAAVPTVAALIGADAMAGLARALWHRCPPTDGDVDLWGDALADFIETDPQLADLPYLADVARLDRAVQQAERAADDDIAPVGLEQLGTHEPPQLRLQLRAGHAVVDSAWPLHSLWTAHRPDSGVGPDDVRHALAAGLRQPVRVRRQGLRAVVEPLDGPTVRFEQALLQHAPLSAAWAAGGDGFDFEPWFLDTLRRGGLRAVSLHGEVA